MMTSYKESNVDVKTVALVLTVTKKYQGLGVPYSPGKIDSTYQVTKVYRKESSSSISST